VAGARRHDRRGHQMGSGMEADEVGPGKLFHPNLARLLESGFINDATVARLHPDDRLAWRRASKESTRSASTRTAPVSRASVKSATVGRQPLLRHVVAWMPSPPWQFHVVPLERRPA
jgi:hypothetical protein